MAKQLSGTTDFWPDTNKLPLSGRRVLVTGATGFIGSHLVRRLVGIGCEVVAMTRPSSNLWRIKDTLSQVKIVKADMDKLVVGNLESGLKGVEVVYHLAAAGVDQCRQDAMSIFRTNVMGTVQLLRLAHSLKTIRFIYCGSCFEYGPGSRLREDVLPRPQSEYGASKVAAWSIVHAFSRQYGLPTVTLRPFTVYGPFEAKQRLVPYTIVKALQGSTIDLTGGEQSRDFVFVEDVIEALLEAAAAPEAPGCTMNVCTGVATLVKDLVNTLVELIGNGAAPRFGTIPYRDTEMRTLSGDPGKARQILGWAARTPLHDGLGRTVLWFRQNLRMYGA